MCGIVGFLTKEKKVLYDKHLTMFEEMLICDSIRGNDSTGVFTVLSNNQVKALKTSTNPHYLMETTHWRKFRDVAIKSGHVLVGHNRKATFGNITRENAHPFAEKNIVLVHNGTVSNHKQMADVDVDSHAICHDIAERGHIETLRELNGSYTLVWFDVNTKQLHLARNDDRPLSLIETTNSFAFASEGSMLAWILRRNAVEFDKVEQLKAGIVLSVSWNPFKVNVVEIPTKKKIVSLPASGTTPWQSQGVQSWGYYNDCYTKNTPVIFIPDNYVESSNHIGRFRLTGMAYLPGKPILHNAVGILDAEKDERDCMDLATEDKLIANVRNLVLTNDDQIVVYLDKIRSDVFLDLWNGGQIPETEWRYFVEHFKCSKCNGDLREVDNQLTSISREPTEDKITCANCVCANYNEMPIDVQKRITDKGRVIDAVK